MYLRCTYGVRWVSSLAISARFSLILPDLQMKSRDRRNFFYKMVDFPIRKRDFRVRGWSGASWEPLERKREETKCIYSRPYRTKKSASTFLLPKKKNIWWRATIRGALAGRRSTLGQPSVILGSTLGQPWVNLGSTLGQPSVNVRSTLGIFPSHLGPILGIFIGCFNQTRKILLTYFSNG